MNNDIPIIIFHLGNQEYVKLCLQQVKKYNNNVILLNNNPDNFKEYQNETCQIVNYRDYYINANSFTGLYKHFSSNSHQLELICIIRWIIVYQYMKSNNIKRAFICDSDILIYENITSINHKYLKDYALL